MNRKFLISLIPLLVTAAFVVLPAAAQAVTKPHWFSNAIQLEQSNGNLATEEFVNNKEAVRVATMKGTLELIGLTGAAEGAKLICNTASAGLVYNPIGGGAGRGNIEQYAVLPATCTDFCAGANIVPEPASLPWPLEIIGESPGFRVKTKGIKLTITCNAVPKAFLEGEDEPAAPSGPRKGTSALHPGYYEFAAGSGELKMVSAFGGTPEGGFAWLGDSEIIGFSSNELINIR